MSILSETIEIVKSELGSELDEITVEMAVFGLFFSGVKLSTGQGGLCYTPIKDMPEAVCCPSSARAMPLSGKLSGRPVTDYLNDVENPNILRRTLGISALNALSMLVWDRKAADNRTSGFKVIHDANAFDLLDLERYKKSVVVGALVPILRKLIAIDADFHVLEQDPRTLKEREMPYYLPAEKADTCIPDADLLVITGVTILNDTLPGLLKMAKPGAEVLVTGPTASMLPDALFAHGVTMAGGIRVTRPDELLNIISEGGSGYHFFGKYAEQTVLVKEQQ
ncbi:MAG: Rossmann-like domain-containing protein [Anaerovoracaceae bacterium]|jgi:uncharacterized protein (DUF4213/DUF364 family)